MSIEMAGGVYCPLSPRDPQQRLHALVEQTPSHIILVHWMTRDMFRSNTATLDIDTPIEVDVFNYVLYFDRLSSVRDASESIAYIIFTSGSTGTPKAVGFVEQIIVLFLVISYVF